MKFVVDANIIFALANPSSVTSEIVENYDLTLVSPDFCLHELSKYKEIITKKSQIPDFDTILNRLKAFIIFIDFSEYKEFIKKALSVLSDKGDAPYLALALKLGYPIWSNDKMLKNQPLAPVLSTEDILKLII